MKIIIYSEKTKKQYILLPICANYVLTPKGFVSHDHLHPVYHLVYMIQGQGTLTGDNCQYSLKEKDIFIVNPNEKHVYTSVHEGGMTHYTVNFHLLSMEKYQSFAGRNALQELSDFSKIEPLAETDQLHHIFDFKVQDVFVDYDKYFWKGALNQINAFSEMIEKVVKTPFYLNTANFTKKLLLFSDYYSKFIIDFFQLISGFETNNFCIDTHNRHSLLNDITQYLNACLTVPFRLSELASALNYSPVYISAFFKQHTGMTITQYINKLKITTACEYLRNSDKSVSEIASILNFSSSNHFSNNFKKEKKISPKYFRKHSELH